MRFYVLLYIASIWCILCDRVFRIILFLTLSNMIRYGLVLRSLGHTRDILIANLIAFFIAIALTYPFIRYFGIIGAALSAVLVFNANALSQLFFSAKKLEITFVKLFPLVTLFKFTCIGGVLFVFISLLVDVSYAYLDPRIRYD